MNITTKLSTAPELDLHVLGHVRANPGCTSRDVASTLTPSPTNSSRERLAVRASLRGLEQRGLVSRERDTTDRWYPVEREPTSVTLTHKQAWLVAHVLRTYLARGELGQPSAVVLADIESQMGDTQ